jgi:hypothetical protein
MKMTLKAVMSGNPLAGKSTTSLLSTTQTLLKGVPPLWSTFLHFLTLAVVALLPVAPKQ